MELVSTELVNAEAPSLMQARPSWVFWAWLAMAGVALLVVGLLAIGQGGMLRFAFPAVATAVGFYCHPTYGEPFANSVLEALASGRSIVATNAGGIREMIPDGGGPRFRRAMRKRWSKL